MFKVGISGDLLNSSDEPCFGMEPLNLLKNREDIELTWRVQEEKPMQWKEKWRS